MKTAYGTTAQSISNIEKGLVIQVERRNVPLNAKAVVVPVMFAQEIKSIGSRGAMHWRSFQL